MSAVPVTAIQQIIAIPDDAFTPYDVPGNRKPHTYLEFYPDRSYDRTLLIAPHHHEAWLNVHLFKIALFCREHNIKLISIGHKNQLPFFGMFSDAVILQEGSLDAMFGWFSTFATDTTGFDRLPGWHDVYAHDTLKWDEFCIGSDAISLPAGHPDSVWRTIYGMYCAEHVIAAFSDCRIFMRASSLSLFEELNEKRQLPKDAIWCEVKERFGKVNSRLKLLLDSGFPLVGLDKTMQRDLVRSHGSHFMSLQILCSLFNGCRLLLAAGSAHVFAVAPANLAMCLGAADRFYDAQTEIIVRKLNLHRFGSVPYTEEATIPVATTEHPFQHSADKDKAHVAHWQIDYFLDEDAMRAYLACALAMEPKVDLQRVDWETYRAESCSMARCSDHFIKFCRASGESLMTTRLLPNGRLNPHSFNETYWACVGNRLMFKNHFGQTTTVFRVTGKETLRGKFIYKHEIEHVVTFVPDPSTS